MKKKILVLAHSASIGGAEFALASLIESTHKSYDWHIVFADTKKADSKLTKHAKGVDYVDLPWWCYEAHDSPKKINRRVAARNYATLDKLAREADVLLTNTLTVPWLSFVAASLGKPHIWYVHEFGDIDHSLKFVLGYSKSLKIIGGNSSRVLTISNAVKNHLARVIDSRKIDIINQSINLDALLDLPANLQPNNKGTLSLLCIGAIKPSKGQLIAIDAAKILGGDTKLDVIGPNANAPYVSELKLAAAGLQNITVQDRAYNVTNELESHDIVLMCSSNEALGRITIEALAAGKLVMGYDCTSTRELLDDGRGIVYSPNEPDVLALAIKDSSSFVLNVKKNRKFVTSNFSCENQAKGFGDCVARASKGSVPLEPSLSFEQYLTELQSMGLIVGAASHLRKRSRDLAARAVPDKVKAVVKKGLRR